MLKLFKKSSAPTVTVTIQLGSREHCKISYIAKDEKTKHLIEYMVENGHDINEKGESYNTSEKLLEKERELGLKRQNTKDENGLVVPAYHSVGFFQEKFEYWDNGKRDYMFGIHEFAKQGSQILPVKNHTVFFMDEGKEKQEFIANYKTYYKIPALV